MAVTTSQRSIAQQLAALPYRVSDDGLEVLLVTTSDTRRWIIPKGWPMKGKTPAVAAAREAFEETGVRGAIGRAPVGRFTYKKVDRQGASQTIEVEVFLLRVTRQKRDWPERKMRTTKWMLREDAANVVDEGSLKILLRTFNV